jgi:phytanoyl-CoA hydroxylase
MKQTLSPFPFKTLSSVDSANNREQLRSAYSQYGIIHLKEFYTKDELGQIHAELAEAEACAMRELVEKWGGHKITFYTKPPVKSVTTENSENFVFTPYFQASASSAHVFFEEIKNQTVVNRIGHGLHLKPEYPHIHGSIYKNESMRTLLHELGYIHPICLLSVYIPKHPHGFGSEVKPHQESAFANTAPLSSGVLWVALEDATLENACMWGLLGSHKLPLKFVSKVDHERKTREYVQINEAEIPEFKEGELAYSPLEVRAGDALFFHGNFVHCSPQNLSQKSRKAMSFQFVETENVTFNSFNWIKFPNQKIIF